MSVIFRVSVARWIVFLLILSFSGYWSIPAVGAAEPSPDDSRPSVTAASRLAEDPAGVASWISIVTAEEIAHSTARNVPEVLNFLVGLPISDYTGNQRNYFVGKIGFGGDSRQNMLLLIDGRIVNLPDASSADWNLIPLDRIERIEVVRGSRGSVFYGDHAVAGIVNIITRQGRESGAEASLAYGSYDTLKASAAVGGNGKRLSYEISGAYQDSDGYRENSAAAAKDLGANFHLYAQDRWHWYLSGGYHQDDTRNPGFLTQGDAAAGLDRTQTQTPGDFSGLDDYYALGGVEVSILSQDTFKLEASYRRRAEKESATLESTPSGGAWDDGKGDTAVYGIAPQLIFREDFEGISNRILMGYDLEQVEADVAVNHFENALPGPPSQAYYDALHGRQDSGIFIHDQLDIGSKVTLSGGYRIERASYRFEQADLSEKIIEVESMTAGATYLIGTRTRIFGSYTRGFRLPRFDELINYQTASINSDLGTPISINYEIGVNSNVGSRMNLTLNFFHTTTKDEIFYDPGNARFYNTDWTTLHQGVELSAQFNWRRLRLGAGYTYLDAKFETGAYAGSQIPDLPNHVAYANLGYTLAGGFYLGLEGLYTGTRYVADDFTHQAPLLNDYWVVNAKLRYPLRWITISVDLNNILDQEYAAYGIYHLEAGYFPAPKFNFLAGVKIHF